MSNRRHVSRQRRHAERVCSRKRWYADKEAALAEAERLQILSDERASVYQCPVCNRWHVTHYVHSREYRDRKNKKEQSDGQQGD